MAPLTSQAWPRLGSKIGDLAEEHVGRRFMKIHVYTPGTLNILLFIPGIQLFSPGTNF